MRRLRLVTCRHFTGLQRGTCAAGVEYTSDVVRKPHASRAAVFSCVRDDRWLEQQGTECPSYVATTEAEVDAQEARYRETFRLLEEGTAPCCRGPVEPKGDGLACPRCGALLLTQRGRA
jgi:hypothetical protein